MHSSARRPAVIMIVGCCVGLIAAAILAGGKGHVDELRVPRPRLRLTKSPMWRSTERTTSPSGRTIVRRNSDIYGARVSSAGSVLDPSGIQLTHASTYQLSPT